MIRNFKRGEIVKDDKNYYIFLSKIKKESNVVLLDDSGSAKSIERVVTKTLDRPGSLPEKLVGIGI